MKPKTSILFSILLAIVFFFLGVFLYEKFVALYLFSENDVIFESLSPSDQTKHVLMFSACVAAIPLVSLLLKLRRIKSIMIAMAIVTGFLIFGILIKRLLFMVLIEADEVKRGWYYLSLDKVLPELYMIVALIIGYFLLRHLKKEEILFRKDSPDLSKEIISQLPSN